MTKHEPTHTLVVSIDGLRASALGAYGAAAYETPHLDAFATEACVWDWCYANSPDPAELCSSVSTALADYPLAAQTLIASDDESFLQSPLAERFDVRHRIETASPSDCATSISETVMARVWAEGAAAIASALEQSPDEKLFAWLHTRGLYGPWDAPVALHEALLDEDDPPIPGSVTPPDNEITEHAELCEARFAASCRYAGQVMTLDACLGGWMDIVQGLFEGQTLRLILLGWRGFPLGEHGRVGGVDDRLYSQQQHVPLMATLLDPQARFNREATVSTIADALSSVLAGARLPGHALLESPSGARVVHDPHWTLRRPAPTPEGEEPAPDELFSKPDDRWEQNDVAQLEPQTCESLAAMLAPSGSEEASS